MLIEAEAARGVIEMTRAEPRGVVRSSCLVARLHAHVGRMLADFMAAHPHVSVHLEASNRSVSPVNDTSWRASPASMRTEQEDTEQHPKRRLTMVSGVSHFQRKPILFPILDLMLLENESEPKFNRTRAQSSPLSIHSMQLHADLQPPEVRSSSEDVPDGKAIAAVRSDYAIAAEQESLLPGVQQTRQREHSPLLLVRK